MLVSPPAVSLMATVTAATPSVAMPRYQPATETPANSVLSRLIEEQSWTEALSRLQTHPSEAAQVIRKPFGDVLPLHEACKLQPPANFVEALVAAFRPAARMPGCHSSSLPVHLAIQTGSKDALAPLICAYPAGARKKDDRGRLPIHLGCEWEAPVAAISALLTLYPESINVRDANGKSPMDYAIKSKMMGRDVDQIIETLKNGPAYCAVSKSAYTRLKEEFDMVMKDQVKAHEEKLAEIERNHNFEVEINRQLEEGYRSGLRSMRKQANTFRSESLSLMKEKESLKEQLRSLQNAKKVLHAHVDTLEWRLHEKIAELEEACIVGELREAQIQEMEERIGSTEMLLGERCSQLDATEKELCKVREQVNNLTRKTTAQVVQIKEVTTVASLLEAQLKKSCNEAKEEGKSLRDAVECIGILKADVSTKEIRISELSARVDELEAQVKGQREEIESKDATIESAQEQNDILSSKLDSMASLRNEQEKQVLALSGQVELLEGRLEEKSADLEDTSCALAEAKRRMEVLLRNMSSKLWLNVCHVKQIFHLNKTVVSPSTSLNGFIFPRDLVEKAIVERTNSLGLILENNDKFYELMGKVSEWRMSMVDKQMTTKKNSTAIPVKTNSIAWEHYVPQTGDSMIAFDAPINFSPPEGKEIDMDELVFSSLNSTLADEYGMCRKEGEEWGATIESVTICLGKSDVTCNGMLWEEKTVDESKSVESLAKTEVESFDDGSVQDKAECCEVEFVEMGNAALWDGHDKDLNGNGSAYYEGQEDYKEEIDFTKRELQDMAHINESVISCEAEHVGELQGVLVDAEADSDESNYDEIMQGLGLADGKNILNEAKQD